MKQGDPEGVTTIPEPNQLAIALLQFLRGFRGRDTRPAAPAKIQAGADGDMDSGPGRHQVGTDGQLLDIFWTESLQDLLGLGWGRERE